MSRKIIYDAPASPGVQNFLNRCRQMTGIQWTPAQEVCYKQDLGGYPYLCPAKNGKKPENPGISRIVPGPRAVLP